MITKKNLYTIAFVALGLIGIISIYYLSRKSECCGSCHIASAQHSHDHDHDEANGAEHISVENE